MFLFIIYFPEETTEGKVQLCNASQRRCTIKALVNTALPVLEGVHG